MASPGRSLSANLHLLDRQVLDVHGRSTAKVDDLEFAFSPEAGSLPEVSKILCGPAALGRRFGGRLGSALETLHQLLHPAAHAAPAAISIGVVTDIGPAIHLSVALEDLEVSAVDDFLSEHFIGHIPGAGTGPSERRDADAGE
jgi:hypothetical protein